jgi:hypothetical protein
VRGITGCCLPACAASRHCPQCQTPGHAAHPLPLLPHRRSCYTPPLLHAESNPALSRWGDVLFYSTIGNLYCAAQLDAIASVGQTWAETAIRLALYLSPLVSVEPCHELLDRGPACILNQLATSLVARPLLT